MAPASLPSLRQLQYLVALASRLSFTRAAADCFVTQSTLSTAIRELEDTLGARLVERDRQSVALTATGAAVVERARALLAQAQDLTAFAAAAGAPLSGTVRLGVIPTIAPFTLPVVLPQLRARFAQLQLALREDLTHNLLARLDAGALDFALIALPYATGALLVEPLLDDELWLVGPVGEPLLAAGNLRISAALAGRLLLLEEGHCLREHTLAACRRAEPAHPGAIEATSLLTLLQMVESGLGLALIPELAIKAGLLDGTGLMARPLAAPAPRRTLALVARRTTARLEEFHLLADFFGNALAQRGGRARPSVGRRGKAPRP
jgi:LysR family hydrogen peroxide-inducible transcriptional activator